MHRLGLGVFVGLVGWLPAACGSESGSAAVTSDTAPLPVATTPAETTNSVGTGPRLWVQPLFPSDESLAAPVNGILRYDATNDDVVTATDAVG